MNSGIRIGKFGGIPVGLNWSLLVIGALLTFSLGAAFLPAAAPGLPAVAYWLVGAGAAVVFFGSILAHEFGHALAAKRRGIKVRGITLWFLGGVAVFDDHPKTARDEFVVAAAGPAVSVALAGGFAGAALLTSQLVGAAVIVAALWWLAIINGLLAVFNLLPGAPLDGGRILGAYLWHRNGDEIEAKFRAAKAGRTLSIGLIAVGLWSLFAGGSFLLPVLGWFLFGSATAERDYWAARRAQKAIADTPLAGFIPTSSAMIPAAAPLPEWMTVDDLLSRVVGAPTVETFALHDPIYREAGVVTYADLLAVPGKDRPHVRLREIARPLSDMRTVRDDQPLTDVQFIIATVPTAGQIPVVNENGSLVGVIGAPQLTHPSLRMST